MGPPRMIEREGPAVALTAVSKSFPGVRALTGVDFDCRPGEVHALVGENGSGKSTLIKVAAGVLIPDSGEVRIAGELLTARGGINHARRLGLLTAYQDTSLVPELTVAENIALSFNTIGQRRPTDLQKSLERYGLPFSQAQTISSLGPGARQLLEVARAMLHDPKVLLLDEPTAALDMRLSAHLAELIKRARDDGVGIVYVSHRLEEVRTLADRLTVLRDGVIQGTHSAGGWDVDEIIELMVGAPTELEFPQRSGPSAGATRLEVSDLAGEGFGPASLTVGAGEIVGVAGAEGNGQRALLRGLIGTGRTTGTVRLDGQELRRVTPRSALEAGISFQSGDRMAESIYGRLSVMDNVTAQASSASGPAGLALPWRLKVMFARASKQLGIVSASPYQPIGNLSGGNQQKAVLARPTLRRPKVLVVDEPTQGVDARARMDIYRVLADHADEGLGVLVNSSDSVELAGLCDRIYVMSRGRVVDEIVGSTSETEIVHKFVSAAGVESTAPESATNASVFKRALFGRQAQVPIFVLLLLSALLAIYAGRSSEFFWTSQNLANLLLLCLPLGFVAIGQQFTLLSGGFDISVGATMSLSVVLISMTLPDVAGARLALTLVTLLIAAVAIGLFNSFLINILNINAIVATIATLGIVGGIAIVLRPQPEGIIAPDLGDWMSLGFAFIPWAFVLLVAVAVALEVWLYRTRSGLGVRAVGFNADSGARIGLRVGLVRSTGLIGCALGAVIAGVFLASQTGIGANDVGASYALPCFAAVFLGGAVLTGGRGSFVGALLGAVFLSLVENVAPLIDLPNGLRQVIYGGMLVATVAAYGAVERLRAGGRSS